MNDNTKNELPTGFLLPGFTPQAERDLQARTDIVLIHRWSPELSEASGSHHELDGKLVKSCVRVVESRGGGILIQVPWLQRFVVARADIMDWHVVAQDVPAHDPIPSSALRAAHHDYRYPESPWTRHP